MKVKFLPIEEKHLEIIRTWRNSEEIKKYMYTETYITEEMQKQWFKNLQDKKDEIHWIIEVDGVLAGKVDLRKIDPVNKTAEWSFYLGNENARSKGAGVLVEYKLLEYAFSNLGLHKLNCAVLDFNTRVIELHKKFGFVEEGRIRQQILKHDKRIDVVLLGMLAGEWERNKVKFSKIIARFNRQ